MNKITREQYLEALEAIDQYHLQNDNIKRIEQSGKTLIDVWVASHNCSVRLSNILRNYPEYFPVKYIEDVNWRDFKRLIHAGHKSYQEFEALRRIIDGK